MGVVHLQVCAMGEIDRGIPQVGMRFNGCFGLHMGVVHSADHVRTVQI